jgi:hypothetical protein
LSWLTIEDEDALVLTPEAVQDLDLVKRLLQRWIDDGAAVRSVYAAKYMTVITYRGMGRVNMPATERQAWLEEISRRCLAKDAAAKRPSRRARTVQNGQELAASSSPATIAGTGAGTPAAMAAASRLSAWNEVAQMQLWIARLLIEEGQIDQTKQILRQVQAEAPANHWQSHVTVRLMHDVVADCHDPQLLADFERWCKRLDQQPPHPMWVKWPLMDVFADRNHLPSPTKALDGNLGDDAPPVQFLTIRVRPQTGPTYHWRYSPLARGDGRLYFVRSQVQFAGAHPYDIIAYVLLDDQNRPIGKANAESDGFWNSVRSMPPPQLGKSPSVTSALYVDGRLYLGTCSTGLQAFDPKTESWKGYGPEQGLPSSMVRQCFSIGGQMLYCNAGDSQYTFDAADGSVKLFQPLLPPHLDEPHKKGMFVSQFLLTWREGSRLTALDAGGLWTDLLSTSPRHLTIDHAAYDGWGSNRLYSAFQGAAEADGRRFCTTFEGLHELDSANQIVRSWWGLFHVEPSNSLHLSLLAPPTCPLPYPIRKLYAIGSRLVLANGFSLTVYDVKTDTWYGPLCFHLSGDMLVTPDGALWGTTPSQDGLAYVSLDDVMLQAKEAGRVMTTAEFLRRRQAFVDAAPPLDGGKLLIGMRQFDKAKSVFRQVLEAKPNQPEALLLMGFLHDRDCLRQPNEAVKYYRRLAELKDNPNASFSGMYFWMCVLQDCQRWDQALGLSEALLQQYPGLDQGYSHYIQAARDRCRQELAKKGVKQPPGGASNKEERPVE